MSNESNKSTGGIGFLGLLGLAFIILKLCGVINWSWWWVTVPLWGGLAIVLAVLGIVILVASVIPSNDWTSKKERPVKKSNFQKKLEEMAEKRKQQANQN